MLHAHTENPHLNCLCTHSEHALCTFRASHDIELRLQLQFASNQREELLFS